MTTSFGLTLSKKEISKIDSSVAVVMSVCNSLVNWGIEEFGNEAQKEKILLRKPF